ncbi:SRPBCC family protein [Nocardia jejuensis]|uniref:SRPBCC family protein n=1 Tax=Nocardia jejuensis TaxID=328049 RepID=UPI0008295595|nr:SRPBCC family protein [Nocardia jejuensis]
MTEVTVLIPKPVDEVFAILADGWSYGHWVVGSTHIRRVDSNWPQVGSRIHHSVGAWPLMVQDSTAVLEVESPHLLELQARLWSFGQARIRMELSARDSGDTLVRMIETVTHGPAALMPDRVLALLLGPRNDESLARLKDLAVSRYSAEG